MRRTAFPGRAPFFPPRSWNAGPVSAGHATAAASFSAGPAQRPSLPPTGRTVRACDIVFSYGPWGKPLAGATFPSASPTAVRKPCWPSVRAAPSAVTSSGRGALWDARGIADFFHPRERLALDALPPDDYARGFYRMWVRKEAVMKACGKGLGTGSGQVLVSAESGGHHAQPSRKPFRTKANTGGPLRHRPGWLCRGSGHPEERSPSPHHRHRLEIPFC